MKPEDQHLAKPERVKLRDGREVTLRLLEKTDGEAMADFYVAIPDKDGIYYLPPSARTRDKALDHVNDADNDCEVVLVLVDDLGVIHGEAWYRWSAESEDRSTFGICIRRTLQGVGAGRTIINRLIEIGTVYGPPIMTLTAQIENERACKLYVSVGFVILREQMREPREDTPTMPEYYMERKMGLRSMTGNEAPQQ